MKNKIKLLFITFILLFTLGVSKAYAYTCITGVPALDGDGKQVGCVSENSYKTAKEMCIDGYRPAYYLASNGMPKVGGGCVPEKTTTKTQKTGNKTQKTGNKTQKTGKKRVGTISSPISSSTSGTFYRYRWDPTLSQMVKKGMITYDWFVGANGSYSPEKNGNSLCANDPTTHPLSCRHNIRFWNLYHVKVGSKYYIVYCINPSRGIDHKATVTQDTTLKNMDFTDQSLTAEEREKRIELLETLLLYGHNISPNNDLAVGTVINRDPQNYLRAIAMQVLIYEVSEGGRGGEHAFDTIEPNIWGGDANDPHQANSMFNKIIRPNGGDITDPEERKNTLYGYYEAVIKNIQNANKNSKGPAFNEENYVMSWDSLNKKYTVTINGLGDYKEACESDNDDIELTLDTSGDGSITLSSTKPVKNAKITCGFGRGNGTGDSQYETFRYFRFTAPGKQDLLYGSGYKIFSDYFYVSSENSNILIKKIDSDSKALSGAKFTLTHMTNLDYSVNIDGNGAAQNLTYSGKYRVSETTVPEGYDKINDFNITINAKTQKITDCENKKVDDAGTVVSCLNNQVQIVYGTGGTIELTVVDMPKNFKIIKVNKEGAPINGASFEIRDKGGNLLRFTKGAGGVYKYDASGSVTTIGDSNSSSYPIALLPEGEYKIIETAAPANYRLPIDESSRTTLIKINANRELSIYDKARKTYVPASNGAIRVINYDANISVHKTGNGKPLAGVQFELYNSDKTVKLKSVMGYAGVYTYAEDQTTAETTVYVTNSTGDITIHNVPEGTYYLKEIATVEPFVLPDGVYTKVVVKVDENGVSINGNYTLSTIEISNTPNSFNFYKRDQEGNSLSGGKYKIQKYNKKTKKYEDVKISEVQNDGTYADNADVFKEDSTNGKIQFTLTKGIATFVDMQSDTTYRIIEIEAPEGFAKVSAEDTAMVTIDEHGNASGLLVLVDPRLPDDDASAFAELIINIQTGKQRILYAAVIFVVVGAIVGLIIYNNKKKK